MPLFTTECTEMKNTYVHGTKEEQREETEGKK